MRKNKFYIFVVILISIFVFGSALACVTEAQFENILNRYPRSLSIAFIFFLVAGEIPGEDEDSLSDRYYNEVMKKGYKGTFEEYAKVEEEEAWGAILEVIRHLEETVSKETISTIDIELIVGTNDDFKPVKATSTSTPMSFSAIQSSIAGIDIDPSKEKVEITKKEQAEQTTTTQEQQTTQTTEQETTKTTEQEKPTGTITLVLNIGCPGEMIINFDTGAVTGSYSCTNELENGEIGTGVGAFSGSIDINSGVITTSGSQDYTAYGETITFPITLQGVFDYDSMSAQGTLINLWGEVPWTGAAK